MKTPESIARDEWIAKSIEDGTCTARTLITKESDYYLKNRLERAFLAGLEAGKRIERERGSK